jgi:hypothetical protein
MAEFSLLGLTGQSNTIERPPRLESNLLGSKKVSNTLRIMEELYLMPLRLRSLGSDLRADALLKIASRFPVAFDGCLVRPVISEHRFSKA